MTKYAPISDFLVGQAGDTVRLGFDAVERILGANLPRSAADYQAWWANDPSHSQAKAWLDAGWQTENLNLRGRTVEFRRVRRGRVAPASDASPATPVALGEDPWGALAGTVTILDEDALVSPTGEAWEAASG